MIRRYIIIYMLVFLAGCQIAPSKYEFNSQLTSQQDGGQACEGANPGFYTESGGDEVIAIRFGNGLNFFDLRPEGKYDAGTAVRWSTFSYDKSDRYAELSAPDKLQVGEVELLTGKQVCVTFYPGLFEDDELSLQRYRELSGRQCCGVLSKKRIEKE